MKTVHLYVFNKWLARCETPSGRFVTEWRARMSSILWPNRPLNMRWLTPCAILICSWLTVHVRCCTAAHGKTTKTLYIKPLHKHSHTVSLHLNISHTFRELYARNMTLSTNTCRQQPWLGYTNELQGQVVLPSQPTDFRHWQGGSCWLTDKAQK